MLTNKLSLPEPFHRAAERSLHNKGDGVRYSVTELIDSPRKGALTRLYGDMIVEDVADRVDALMGTMFHKMLEAAGAPETGAILEERLYAEVDGIRISGAMDHTLLEADGTLDDFKTCKCYAVLQHKRYGKFEWIAQTNIYRWLRALHGQQVERLRIIPWIKDWNMEMAIKSAATEGDYPEHAIVALDVPVWPLAEVEKYVRERVRLHVEADIWAEGIGTNEYPEPLCTDEERWRKPHWFAVMKPGRKSALPGKHKTLAEAQYAATQTPTAYVEERGGQYNRCINYCSIGRGGLCTQWNADQAAGAATTIEVDTSAFD